MVNQLSKSNQILLCIQLTVVNIIFSVLHLSSQKRGEGFLIKSNLTLFTKTPKIFVKRRT